MVPKPLLDRRTDQVDGLIMAARDFDSLPRVSYKEHRDAWNKLQEDQYLDEAAMRFMTHASDFVTTRVDRSYTPFTRLIYDWPNSPMAVCIKTSYPESWPSIC